MILTSLILLVLVVQGLTFYRVHQLHQPTDNQQVLAHLKTITAHRELLQSAIQQVGDGVKQEQVDSAKRADAKLAKLQTAVTKLHRKSHRGAPVAPEEAPSVVDTIPLLLMSPSGEVLHEVSWHQEEVPEIFPYNGRHFVRQSRRVDGAWEFIHA